MFACYNYGMKRRRRTVLSGSPRNPLIAAHRGASRAAPENSLAAVERAIEFGADMVEIDVRRTEDGVLIAHHDPCIGRDAIASLTYAQVADAKGHHPATINCVASLASGRTRLDVELKEAGYEGDVLDALHRHVAPEEYIITSFLGPAISAARQAGARRTGLLCETPAAPGSLLGAAESCGADVLAPHVTMADEDLLEAASARDVPVLVWTVNASSELARCLRDPRIAGVITDVPDVAVTLRDQGAPSEFEESVA